MQVLTDGELSSETFGTRSGHNFEAGKAGIVVPLRAWNLGFAVVFCSNALRALLPTVEMSVNARSSACA